MRRWTPLSPSMFTRSCRLGVRFLSTAIHDVERVKVRCGLSGSLNLDLYNTAKLSSSNTLLLYLPPYSATSANEAFQPPSFCWDYPTAVINYRWSNFSPFRFPDTTSTSASKPFEDTSLAWPTPLQDVFRAYSWIRSYLHSLELAQMDIFVYGSYLGASLATSLALTECYPRKPVSVRGCIAYNGIYDWTTSLYDNPNNKTWVYKVMPGRRRKRVVKHLLPTPSRDADYHLMERSTKKLFGQPQHLFDPFASSCLFFRYPGLLVPPDFDASAVSVATLSKVHPNLQHNVLETMSAQMQGVTGYRQDYPPRNSNLMIPDTLLLYSQPPERLRLVENHRKRDYGRTFKDQATRLATSMQESIKFKAKPPRGMAQAAKQQMVATQMVAAQVVGENGEIVGENGEVVGENGEVVEREREVVVRDPLREDIVRTKCVDVSPEMGELGSEGITLVTEWLDNFIYKPPPDDRFR
ncbi:hypothetical protein F4809DRAFT_630992 [Biscogniauxia mediterranea]|nr:hypothetical protein F4809DRAFT_630992 [Biscogniauxia mediterranea]